MMNHNHSQKFQIISYIGLFVLILSLILSRIFEPTSFSRIADDKNYIQTTQITKENCHVILRTDELTSIENLEVYNGSGGKIILSNVEFDGDRSIELQFKALGKITSDGASLVTASLDTESGFLSSSLRTEPLENINAIYSFRTSEFEDYGNHFSVRLYFLDSEDIMRDFPEVTVFLDSLILSEYKKV